MTAEETTRHDDHAAADLRGDGATAVRA